MQKPDFTLPQSIRLKKEDEEVLAFLARRTGINSKSDLIRLALRESAIRRRMPGLVPQAKPKKA